MDNRPGLATSIAMAGLAAAAGIDTVIGMPHWTEDEHETDPAVVRQTARDLQAELNSRAIPLTVLPSNEVFICPDLPDRVKKRDVLTLADRGTHLLLELPHEDLPTYVDDVIFRLQLQGVTPALVHVERYACVGSDWHVLDRTTGDDLAQDLMDRGLIVCTATDAHDTIHRVPCCIWNEWGTSLLAMKVREGS
ncbi:MAG: CpsB/CapC family capsule biosynthesis tyrosine phosphatase [Caldisericia bacterium]